MTTHGEVERRTLPLRWTDWLEWMGSNFPLPMPAWRVTSAGRGITCEEVVEDDHYILRAELPGIDPEKDVEVTVADRALTISAQRSQTTKTPQRSEFFYGQMTRRVTLPPGADAEHVSAAYRDGVLEVSVPLATSASATVPVTRAD
jgi:HSP20 family molecular chaperone IbpA